MKLEPYAAWCGAGEFANVNRTTAYGRGCLFNDCNCSALSRTTYIDPATDNAPWYDSDHPESADFLGFLPQSINLSAFATRTVTDLSYEGSVIGGERLPGRVIEFIGWMIARDPCSMWWGERWLTEVLRGTICRGDCQGEDLELLPCCRDVGGADTEKDFRTLVGAALVDGPRWSDVLDDPCDCFIIQTAQFQVVSRLPYLYAPEVVCLNAVTIAPGQKVCCMVTADQWFDGLALYMRIEPAGQTSAGNILIENRVSFNGTCNNLEGEPCWAAVIPFIERGSYWEIDGRRRMVNHFNPSSKQVEPGLNDLVYDGLFMWPDVASCTQTCVCVTNNGATPIKVTLSSFAREL